MKTIAKPKYEIGQKVLYTKYTKYILDWNEEQTPYKGKSDYIADNIVLYGTIEGIELNYNTFKYSITVEEHKGLDENNLAVDCQRNREETWNLEVDEEDVFNEDELEIAKQKALKNRKERIKYEKKREKEQNAALASLNATCLYDFLLREYSEFNIKYSEEQLNAFYQLICSPRLDLCAYNFQADLKDKYHPKYEICERAAIDKDKQYVELLRKCLKVEGYDEV